MGATIQHPGCGGNGGGFLRSRCTRQSRRLDRGGGSAGSRSSVRVRQHPLLLDMRRLRSHFTTEANNRSGIGEARRNMMDEAYHGQIRWRNRQRGSRDRRTRSRHRKVSHGCLPRTLIASALLGSGDLGQTLQLPRLPVCRKLLLRHCEFIPGEFRRPVEGVEPLVAQVGFARFAIGLRKPAPSLGTIFTRFGSCHLSTPSAK
jgi:hypothetical protein